MKTLRVLKRSAGKGFACALVIGLLSSAAFAQQTTCKPTVVGRIETVTLNSRIFHNVRQLRVWLPPKFDPTLKYPVLYLLDGAMVFDACTALRHEEMGADETLTDLITAGRIPPLIAVGIDNGSDVIANVDDGTARASEFLAYGDDAFPHAFVPLGAAFPDFLESEVMPAIAARYPVRTGQEHTSIWGASYGGAAALYTIAHRPTIFGSAIIESPSLQVGNGQLLRDTNFLIRAPARLAIGVGTAELVGVPNAESINLAIVKAVRQLAQNFKEAYNPSAVTLTITEGGHHDMPTFGRRFAAGLLFLYSRDSK